MVLILNILLLAIVTGLYLLGLYFSIVHQGYRTRDNASNKIPLPYVALCWFSIGISVVGVIGLLWGFAIVGASNAIHWMQ
ncbi:MAG TPA: hypothetical protein DHN29_01245 [Cytophagales bacterium]|nr:hypothetical protein [Cytophagales bacterium]